MFKAGIHLTMLIVGGCLSLGGCDQSPPAPPTTRVAAAPAKPVRQKHPHVGIDLEVPAGWQQRVASGEKPVLQWISTDSNPEKPSRVIRVELDEMYERSVDAAAIYAAFNLPGTVADHAPMIDGERAQRIVAKPAKDPASLHVTEELLVHHRGREYRLIAECADDRSCTAEVEAIARSWKWLDIDRPAQALGPEIDFDAFNGLLSWTVPSAVRLVPEKTSTAPWLYVSNFRTDRIEFTAEFVLMDTPTDVSFAQAVVVFSADLDKFLKTEQPLEFHDCAGRPARVMSQVVEAHPPESLFPGATQVAFVSVGRKRVLAIQFLSTPLDPADREAYTSLATRMVESIRLGTKR